MALAERLCLQVKLSIPLNVTFRSFQVGDTLLMSEFVM